MGKDYIIPLCSKDYDISDLPEELVDMTSICLGKREEPVPDAGKWPSDSKHFLPYARVVGG